MAKDYNESSIQVLSGLDGVRKRPGMYVGDVTSSEGLLQADKEARDNAFDECSNGYSDQMGFIYQADRTCVIWDQGRGIPVGVHPSFKKEKLSTLEIVMTKLHAGGKMNTDSYKNSVGRNGVGVSCLNALSESFIVTTFRDKKWYTIEFSKGQVKTKLKETINPSKRLGIKIVKGTVVEYKPDFTIFKKGIKLDTNKVKDWIKFGQYILPGVKFYYINRVTNKEYVYCNSKGLLGYLNKQVKELGCEDLTTELVLHKDTLDLALKWVKTDDFYIDSFVNGSPTKDGGTHVKGLSKLISDVLSNYGNSRDKFKAEDLLEGLVCVFNYKVDEPLFDNQQKDKLVNKDASDLVYSELENVLVKWASQNKKAIKEIIQRANEIRGAKAQFEQARKAIAAVKGPRGKTSLPPSNKFSGSTTKNNNEREVYIVEGDSAAGTAKAAKDHRFQEILGIRGKILNASKGINKVKLFESEEVLNIMKAIGYNPDSKEMQFRVGKVILLADEDEDGSHINCLVSTLLQTICPELLKNGMLYKVEAPLFVGRTDTKEYYGASMNELKKQYKGQFKSVTRAKGWGEVSPSLLRKVAFDPKTRTLLKIQQVKGKELKEAMLVMGDDSQARKDLLS